MMRRVTAAGIALLVAFVGLLGLATPASAHTPSISATCEALTVNLTQYAGIQPAKAATYATNTTWTKTTTYPNVVSEASPGAGYVQGAVVEREFKKWKIFWTDYQWFPENSNTQGWEPTGKVRYNWTKAATTETKVLEDPATPGAGWTKVKSEQGRETSPAVAEKANTVVVTIDGAVVANEKFGTSFSRAFNFSDKYTAHTYRVQVTAWDGSQYNLDRSGTSTPCSYPVVGKSFGVDCTTAWLYPGRALQNGDHINIEYRQNGQTKQVNAYVDRNVAGGYDTLGLRINGFAPIPLTQQQVQSGKIDFRYSDYVPAGYKVVTWVQFNSDYFNQDRNPAKFLQCGDVPPAPVLPEPKYTEWTDVTAPTCDNFTITQERTVVTYTQPEFDKVNGVWPAPVANAPVTETQTRQATDAEIEALDCQVPANPGAVITQQCVAEGGAQATVTLTNSPDDKWYTDNGTASIVIYHNGDFVEAVAVPEGETVTRSYTYPEDSGTHQLTVRTGPAFGDVLLDSALITTDCIPPQPETPEPTEWVDEAPPVCGDESVTQTRTVYAAPVWNAGTGEWVEDTEGTVETRERPLTEDEIASCPPEPAVFVYHDYQYNCDGTVSHLTSTYTTPYVRVDGEWVLGEPIIEQTWETISADEVPEGEIIYPAVGCENPEPPVTPEPPVKPEVPSTPVTPVTPEQSVKTAQVARVATAAKVDAEELATTGSNDNQIVGLSFGALLLMAGGAGLVLLHRRRAAKA